MKKLNVKDLFICILLLCILTMAVGYSILSSKISILGVSKIDTMWDIKITNITSNFTGKASNLIAPSFSNTTATFNTSLVVPGDSAIYNVTVSNNGSFDALLKQIIISSTSNDAIKISYSDIAEGDILKSQSSITFKITVSYNNITFQPEILKSDFTLDLNYEQKTNGEIDSTIYAYEKLISTAVTSGNGLYEDLYENGRYVFRGDTVNNYITFNNEKSGWRIMSVEADGTLKLIRSSSIGEMSYDSTRKNSNYGTYCSSEYGCNAWAATSNLINNPTNFINGNISGTVLRDADINIYLNGSYFNSIDSISQELIVNKNFGVGGITFNNSDLTSQINEEKSFLWNGKIGLMNVSDYIRANSNYEVCGSHSLNQKNYDQCITSVWIQDIIATAVPDVWEEKRLWTINSNNNSETSEFFIADYGSIFDYQADYVYGIAPVLYIKSDIIISGEGTEQEPYIIM